MKIFTFWQGHLFPYIKLCMDTWKFDYILLNYENLHKYTDVDISNLDKFSLPQIADIVRVHTLRDNGGYWLDADTIMLTDKLPKENMIGFPETRQQSIGFLYTEPNSDMYNEWAEYQDRIILDDKVKLTWDVVGNKFTDEYVKNHNDITIAPIENCLVETYMINGKYPRSFKYDKFYFKSNYHLKDIRPTNMIMLHNSWTPNYYKKLTENEVLNTSCTLSNILNEIL